MKADLRSIKDVLNSFLAEIAEVDNIRKSISAPICTPFNIKDRTPDFSNVEFDLSPDSFWIEDNAYIWVYAEAWYYHHLMSHPKHNKVPKYYLQPAQPIYQEWKDEEKDVIYRGTIIPEPGDAVLNDYLISLASCVQDCNEKGVIWIKSMKSFVQYIREDISFELQGSLECIFPYKMEIRHGYSLQRIGNKFEKVERGYILRNIEDPVIPIDILTASDILKNLATVVLEGRPNSQHTAAEALGFAWLCHAVGSARLMTREKNVYTTPLTALKAVDPEKIGNPLQPKFYVSIQTFHGPKDVPISKILYDFLIALPRNPGSLCIFSKPISTLLRTLYDKGIKASERAKSLGKITFLTFMSQATHWFEHRPCPKMAMKL
jgi:hypothetical protein